jgi:hypothetical protein
MLLPLSDAFAEDEPGIEAALPDEPAMENPHFPPMPRGFFQARDRGPMFKVSYRAFSIGDLSGRRNWYHCLGADRYFFSHYLRIGGGIDLGFDSSSNSNMIFDTNFTIGLQHPSRLNPFLDFVLGLGLYRRQILEQDLYGFLYQIGIDAGVDVFVSKRFFLSFALGWRRPAFRYSGDDEIEPYYLYFDTFTLRSGLGF